jgi:hypothetical protein
MAYGRASWAYREVPGSTAKSSPAIRPNRGVPILTPSRPMRAAAPAMASTEGSRIARSESPKAATQPCMKT